LEQLEKPGTTGSTEVRKKPSILSFKKSLKKIFLDKYTSADLF
jgi:hypothetical protein